MSYLDTDSINSILSGQEIQRLNVESEKTSGKGIGFMRSIVIHMLLRNHRKTITPGYTQYSFRLYLL